METQPSINEQFEQLVIEELKQKVERAYEYPIVTEIHVERDYGSRDSFIDDLEPSEEVTLAREAVSLAYETTETEEDMPMGGGPDMAPTPDDTEHEDGCLKISCKCKSK